MKTVLPLALAVTMTAGALFAQNIVYYPADRENTNANSNDRFFPFSNAVPGRSMLIIPREMMFAGHPLGVGMPVPDGKKITRIGFRKDEAVDSTGHKVFLQIWMGKVAQNRIPGSESSTYMDNVEPGTETLVLDRSSPAKGFLQIDNLDSMHNILWVDLDTPYTYDGSAGLVIDVRLFVNDNANQSFNYYLDMETDFSSARSSFGNSCTGSGGNTPALSIGNGRVGATVTFSLTKATANTLTGMHVNFEKLPAPIKSMALAGDCELWVNPFAVVGGVTNNSGNLNVNANIPNDITLVGVTVYAQAFIQDFFANALGFISTNGYQMTVSTLPRSARINSTGDALANSGTLRRNWAMVTLFEWIN